MTNVSIFHTLQVLIAYKVYKPPVVLIVASVSTLISPEANDHRQIYQAIQQKYSQMLSFKLGVTFLAIAIVTVAVRAAPVDDSANDSSEEGNIDDGGADYHQVGMSVYQVSDDGEKAASSLTAIGPYGSAAQASSSSLSRVKRNKQPIRYHDRSDNQLK
ncbi:unnamed protein product [Allacma fusca]|uniref:Uncharacterized protein n=1 Tax=Allacma fusca TaxID=39272 RepID=A0A8J2KWB5_9HEXA|nr:unnamed protein product [Allacma fusca]